MHDEGAHSGCADFFVHSSSAYSVCAEKIQYVDLYGNFYGCAVCPCMEYYAALHGYGVNHVLLEKLEVATDSSGDFYEKRATLFVADDTLWGDGAGRHAIYAEQYNLDSIRDTCYQRLFQEVGCIGLMLHLLLFGCIIIKCLRHYKHLGFELSVMVFLLISMIGADPLATPDKHCFFYWLVIGRVASFKLANRVRGMI